MKFSELQQNDLIKSNGKVLSFEEILNENQIKCTDEFSNECILTNNEPFDFLF